MKPRNVAPQSGLTLTRRMRKQINTAATWKHCVRPDERTAINSTTHQCHNGKFKDLHRTTTPTGRVTKNEENQNVGGSYENRGPKGNRREDEAEAYRRPNEFCEVSAHYCDLREHIERIEYGISNDAFVSRTVVEKDSTVRSQI